MKMPEMSTPTLRTERVNNIQMRLAVQGEGPLVIMCHGFPESWGSWRHQMAAVAQAGWQAAAPDMRGYGGTDAPADPAAYTMLHHVGDMVDLVRVLGHTQAVIVGHDWGAPVAWASALLRPDVFRAVVGMSSPYSPPAGTDILTALEKQGIRNFYMQYFEKPGVAEPVLEADPEATLRRMWYGISGDAPTRPMAGGMLEPGKGILDAMAEPATLPAWLTHAEIAEVAAEFRRTGFRGALNWYRSVRYSAELLAPWRGRAILQPSMFIAGSRDLVLEFAGAQGRIDAFARTLPGLRGSHILEGAGHWVQRERAAEVSDLLVAFLKGL
jgi:pimeloyl-ACP methyl ester carboxylesterase